MSLIASSVGCFTWPDFCLFFSGRPETRVHQRKEIELKPGVLASLGSKPSFSGGLLCGSR
jgi:hypothetical protein